MKRLLLTGIASLFLASPALAQEVIEIDTYEPSVPEAQISTVEGTYAGTFLCGRGEMGMSLTLVDKGSMEQMCRATGSCNRHDPNYEKRSLIGVLNFFPTISNPSAPSGAFKLNGHAHHRGQTIVRIFLEPGKWIDQPENFGASGLEATLINGHMSGKPTAKKLPASEFNKTVHTGAPTMKYWHNAFRALI